MTTPQKQKTISLKIIHDFVSTVCDIKKNDLLWGDIEPYDRKTYTEYSPDCFLFELNQYQHDCYNDVLTTEGTLKRIWYGQSRSFRFDEAQLYAEFMFKQVQNHCLTNKHEAYAILRPMLRSLLLLHQSENKIDQSFNIDAYLEALFNKENQSYKEV